MASFSHFVGASSCESVFKTIEKKTHQVQEFLKGLPLKLKNKIPKKAQVIHIPQIHYSNFSPSYPEEYLRFFRESIMRTQLSVAKFIMTYKDSIFVSESLIYNNVFNIDIENLEYSDNQFPINKEIVEQNIRSDFYKKDFDELTKEEKYFLYIHDASILLFFLGHIKSVHSFIPKDKRERFVHDDISEEINRIEVKNKELEIEGRNLLEEEKIEEALKIVTKITQLNAKQYLLITNVRESLAKEQIEVLREKYPNKKIFMVFGNSHDFSSLFKDVSFYRVPDSVILPEEYYSHLDSAVNLLRIISQRFNVISQNRDGNGFSKKEIKDLKKGYKRVHKMMMSYLKNKDKYPVGSYSLEKNRYFLDEEIKRKAEEVKLKIRELDALK